MQRPRYRQVESESEVEQRTKGCTNGVSYLVWW